VEVFMSLQENEKLVEKVRIIWKDSNNPKGALELIHPDCEWLLVASGQTFRGRDAIARLIEQSMAPRDAQFEVPNAFAVLLELPQLAFGWEYELSTGNLTCSNPMKKAEQPQKHELERLSCVRRRATVGRMASFRGMKTIYNLIGFQEMKERV